MTIKGPLSQASLIESKTIVLQRNNPELVYSPCLYVPFVVRKRLGTWEMLQDADKQVRFSVIIPLYNGERYLAATLDSILDQSVAPHEIIVVDDGSTDGGPDIVARYAGRVTLITAAGNSGVQAARNLGIARTSGTWIALCDQDDLWAPSYLAAHAALLAADPGITFSFCNFRLLHDGVPDRESKFDQAPPGFWEQAGRRELVAGWVFDQCIARQTFAWHPIFPSASVVARRLIKEVGCYDESMRGLRPEDGEFTLRCLYHARTGAIPTSLVTIRRHESNFSRDQFRVRADEVTVLRFIRSHHAEARPFWPEIDVQINRRLIDAAHGAFANREHARMRHLLSEIGPTNRDLRLRAKAIVVSLPAPFDMWANTALQRLSGFGTRGQ
jgi:glycosyltransferase involved in cell wall biosynthesis